VQLVHGRPATNHGGRLRDSFADAAPACDFNDAADEEALHAIAKQGVDDGVRVWVGAAGLAAELVPALIEKGLHFAGHDGAGEGDPDGPWHDGRQVVVIAGSVHPSTVAQVAAVASAGVAHLAIDPQQSGSWPSPDTLDRVLAPNGLMAVNGDVGPSPLILSTHVGMPDGTPPDAWVAGAAKLLDVIAEALARRLAAGPPLALVVTGGETAQSLFGRLGATAIDVTGEVLPGIPTGRLHAPAGVVPIVTKSGGFGGPSDLVTVLASTGRPPA